MTESKAQGILRIRLIIKPNASSAVLVNLFKNSISPFLLSTSSFKKRFNLKNISQYVPWWFNSLWSYYFLTWEVFSEEDIQDCRDFTWYILKLVSYSFNRYRTNCIFYRFFHAFQDVQVRCIFCSFSMSIVFFRSCRIWEGPSLNYRCFYHRPSWFCILGIKGHYLWLYSD